MGTLQSFEEFVQRYFGQHRYDLLIEVIGKYPDLYRPDLWRIKHPGNLDKKAKKAWDTVIAIMKSRYQKTSEDNIWKCWRWIRTTYFTSNCPPICAGKIGYLNDIKESIATQAASVAYKNLIDGTKQPKPKRIRSRIAYLSQVIRKPFVWSSMDSFLQTYGEEPLLLMIRLIEQYPVLYRQDLENELMQNQLQGKVFAAWSQVYMSLRRHYPHIPETTFYHAWRTLRRNFDHEQAPDQWADRVKFVRNGGTALCTDYLEEGDDDIACTSGFTPWKKISTLNEAMTAIEEIDAFDAVQRKKQQELKRTRSSAVNNGFSSGTNWSTLFGSSKQPSNQSFAGVESSYDNEGDIYEAKTKRPALSTIISGSTRNPPTYKKLVVQGGTAVPVTIRKLPTSSVQPKLETQEIVNDEIKDLLAQMNKTTEETEVNAGSANSNAVYLGDEEYEDIKPEIPELNEVQQEKPVRVVDSHASFKQIIKEKWMEFSAMPDARNNLCLYKKEIMKVIIRTFDELNEAQNAL
uniref:MADF domain-containing protein n=1 Tax=Steinernema glaseri TaxID=37863 RepID=A0A1I7Y416_9BILA